ncbi:MAG: 2-isopropylmalate synthase [Deltaproteobacteria bacterium]|nr:MAG: 2-isopropylmalate synthase [Deltaproteobacteria bacterium]PIE74705.1 MAG: 2-isopropylmalate synthase [Deltaproteobacteria bacterium]
MSSNRVIVFDTTLRDGEQSPGATMNIAEKVRIANRLEELGVDVIEAGFPAASQGDFEAVKEVAKNAVKAQIAGLCRAGKADIDKAWEAVKHAKYPRLHTFIATSELHMKYKLNMEPDKVVEKAVEAVKYAKSFTDNVEFSAEDGSRSDRDFLCRVVEAVIDAGATTVNIPDTVGYALPDEYGELIRYVIENTKNSDKAVISVHCHNDLGLATANTLSAVRAGARQVEVTINGIGERAGNTSLEEFVMTLNTRNENLGLETGIDTTKIFPTSRLVSMITGIIVQPNKAIVGANAFAHESGIHQDGVLKNPMTYEIMSPETVGLKSNKMILGKHSGKAAIKARLEEMGYKLSDDEIVVISKEFKNLCDKKKEILDEDLEALVNEGILRTDDIYSLVYIHVSTGTTIFPTASVKIRHQDRECMAFSEGTGPIDAVFNAISQITGKRPELLRYSITALTGGTDAQGEVTVRLKGANGKIALGKGADSDILTASAKAYINGLNSLEKLSMVSLVEKVEI